MSIEDGSSSSNSLTRSQVEDEAELLEAEADFTRSMQVVTCQKVFQAAHNVLLGDLKSCEPLNEKGSGVASGRRVRSLRWLQPQFDSSTSG